MPIKIPDEQQYELEELARELTAKERRFVAELDVDGNGTQAAIRAGYTPGKSNQSAAVTASRLLRNAKVAAYRRARAKIMCEALGLSRETLTCKAHEIYLRSMQATPVLQYNRESGEYEETGEFQYDAHHALKALEVMAELTGLVEQNIKGSISTCSMTFEQWLEKESERAGTKYEY